MAGRNDWLDGASKAPRTRTIRISRPATGEEQSFDVGGTRIRIRGRQLEKVPVDYQEMKRQIKESMGGIEANRAKRRSDEVQLLKDALRKSGIALFWSAWPFVAGSIALLLFLGGLRAFNPLSVILGLSIGLLAWKGKPIADWFDAREARVKETRRLAEEARRELEVQRRVQATEKPIDWKTEETKVLGADKP